MNDLDPKKNDDIRMEPKDETMDWQLGFRVRI